MSHRSYNEKKVGYTLSRSGVTVRLAVGQLAGIHAVGDTFVSIENITGSKYDDSLYGDAGINILSGDAGNDVLAGGAGADTLRGGTGIDMIAYEGSNAAVNVNLKTGILSGGHAQDDTVDSIENVKGSNYNDVITGNDSANLIYGLGGDDLILGGLGKDVI